MKWIPGSCNLANVCIMPISTLTEPFVLMLAIGTVSINLSSCVSRSTERRLGWKGSTVRNVSDIFFSPVALSKSAMLLFRVLAFGVPSPYNFFFIRCIAHLRICTKRMKRTEVYLSLRLR